MAITESRPAHNDGEPPTADGPGRARRHPWRRRALIAVGALLAAAVVVLAVLAGTYQPVQFGGETGLRFTGLPTATGSKFVNTFGGQQGDWYIPQQSGPFTMVMSISNMGPEPVTIEAVSMLSPQDEADQAQGHSLFPLTPAGRPLWLPMNYRLGQAGKPVAGLSLAHGDDIVVGIPLRMNGICYDAGSFARLDVFYVKVRFGFFTHWVAIPFGTDLLMHVPSDPGGRGARPAQDLVCQAGTTKGVSR